MDNAQPTATRLHSYIASIKRHHYSPLFTPVQLINLLGFALIIFMTPAFTNPTSELGLFIGLVIVVMLDGLFYPLAIQAVVNHPTLSQLVLPKHFVQALHHIEQAGKAWRIAYYDSPQISCTFADPTAQFNNDQAMADH
ncbi:hypothetical protein [Lacticaseibacillus jixiensis]|uniref:hypothetical protein n=1 Tax=Lacticaseibacillus jixiensis TaxID=3231926 RepID=UPI0036F283A9